MPVFPLSLRLRGLPVVSADEEWIDELAGEAEVGAKPHNVLPLIPGRAQLQATLNAPILSDYQRLALRTLYRSGIRPRDLSQIELLDDGRAVQAALVEVLGAVG